ncbi:GNAT family N-acetyltransferase [Streptomyces sanyensis]|uniref:GNAT family N-acetyltransferase n=1 Tax=Streptomyces sanyensis TaxID=568869 RepID=UPI003D7882C5
MTRVLVTARDGSFAARGQVAPTGGTAVVDRIETSAAHRRRGLGRLVVHALCEDALARGATTGVLGGTPDGRALYEALGWRAEAPLVSLRHAATDRTGHGGSHRGRPPADTGRRREPPPRGLAPRG